MTILESLISFVILAIVSVTVVVISSQSIHDFEKLQQHYFAGLVADNELAELQLQKKFLRQPVSGTTEMYGRKWFWTIHSSPMRERYLQKWSINIYAESDNQYSVIQRVTYVISFKKPAKFQQ